VPLNDPLLRLWVLLFLVAFAATTNTRAQVSAPASVVAPAAESIARQLSANDPKAVAWAGYLAGEHRVQESVPKLIDALASIRLQQSGDEWNAARNAVLDALIRLGSEPPADLVYRYYPLHREQALILLSEPRSGRDEVLLKLLKKESGIPWYAIAGMLLEVKSPRFAAELIAGLRLTLEISVVDGPPQPDLSNGVGAGFGIGHGGLYPAPGFPSIATYSLWNSAVRGSTVLAEGPHPIYYRRHISPPDWIPSGPSSHTIEGPDATDRLKYLEELLEHWLPVSAVEAITLKWTTAQRLETQVRAHSDTIGRQYREMLRLAQSANLLSADEVKALVPIIDVRVKDLRRNKSTRLPDVSRGR
jgi:hypothetical protein